MRDIQVRIYRPVALPQMFFGAPALPGFFNFILGPFLLMSSALFEFPFPPVFVVTTVAGHVFLMMWGSRDPHLTTLIQTGHRSRRSPKNLGRRSKTHSFQP
ncbi:VirB3 family type IV secretion system protein [Camelimonas fluminis]|uniref:VirB3 family type IV secretion system protein n=1 Tax=Camelimonas fluminis TaxID=1576911 RepID=A0ABV7UF07_9HYPH|nr:VirB3 family type IV secretion system protein [Camelimonas fluminis]